MLLDREKGFTLDNLALATTVYQSHIGKFMATIIQMEEMHKILGGQIKHMIKTKIPSKTRTGILKPIKQK